MENKLPITRLGKFFSQDDFDINIQMGEEYLHGDINMKLVLFRVDRTKTKTDDVYGEVVEEGIQFLPPVELKGYVQISQPQNQKVGNSKVRQNEPGNLRFSIYQKYLDDLSVDVKFGDYLAYYETEDKVRYYSVADDGRVVSDNKHTYGGYKAFYRTIIATWVSDNEFNGI